MRNDFWILAALAGGVVVTDAAVHASASAYATVSTPEFLAKASAANMFCILASNLALQKTQNRDVRDFSERMISRHTWAGEQLEEIAVSSKHGASLATQLDETHQRQLRKLELAAPGRDFDRRYITAQKDGHAEALARFQEYVQNGQNQELKRFARRVLGSLGRHHTKSQEILEKHGGPYAAR